MKSAILPVLALVATLAQPAAALDLTDLTDEERGALRDEIRAYLLENPEVIMEAVSVLEERQQTAQSQTDSELIAENAEAIFEDGYSWVGGNPDGDVTLVEFMDYRCGYCRRAVSEVTSLLDEDGDIRFILKEFPILGEESVEAARFAIATRQTIGDDAYKKVHDALMTHQGDFGEAALGRLAEDLGLDSAPILAAMESDAVSEEIEANHALGQRLAINGTPSFVMGTQMLRGYLPAAEMQKLVDDIRAD